VRRDHVPWPPQLCLALALALAAGAAAARSRETARVGVVGI